MRPTYQPPANPHVHDPPNSITLSPILTFNTLPLPLPRTVLAAKSKSDARIAGSLKRLGPVSGGPSQPAAGGASAHRPEKVRDVFIQRPTPGACSSDPCTGTSEVVVLFLPPSPPFLSPIPRPPFPPTRSLSSANGRGCWTYSRSRSRGTATSTGGTSQAVHICGYVWIDIVIVHMHSKTSRSRSPGRSIHRPWCSLFPPLTCPLLPPLQARRYHDRPRSRAGHHRL